MAIKFVEVEELGKDDLEEARLMVLSDKTETEARYIKHPETGMVLVAIEDYEDLPIGQMVLLTLQGNDGKDSEYRGVISDDGTFITNL